MIDKGKYRIFDKGYKELVLPIIQSKNPYCNLVVDKQRIAKLDSQKTQSSFWNCRISCKRSECPFQAKLIIKSSKCNVLEIAFFKGIRHNIRSLSADYLSGIDREKAKEEFINLDATPGQVFGKRLGTINAEVFASGNRGLAGRSPKVMQKIKSEVKNPHTKKENIYNLVTKTAKKLYEDDKKNADSLNHPRKFYGYQGRI